MAEYVAVDKEQLEADLGIVADAIRKKGGTSELLPFPNGMKEAVEAIQSGGGAGEFGESYWVENLNGRETCTNLFYGWKSKKVPFFDTSNAESFSQMFQNATIVEVPNYDTSKGTNMFSMFSGCKNLKTIPVLDLSSATRIDQMFIGCSSIERIEVINTRSVTTFSGFVGNCSKLKSVKTLDLSSATNITNIFQNCTLLEDVGIVNGTIKISIKFNNSPNLSTMSIQNIIDGLADLTGQTTQVITWHKEVYAKLTDEQKGQIASKNWTSAST